ncbi:hypothetical protein T05_6017 [Trichinella murrelli]|uniref:Uncharacterized protein n=1 Tax=Trichinella murrelli TaxID=144512 RepID=A0A0V0UG08_9BILA|nr:hypothetical protein T05_6017 [Trichinella murrelli]
MHLSKFTVDFHSISCHLLHGSYNKQTKNNADNNNSNPNKLLSIHAVHLSFMLTKSCFIQVLLLSFHIAKIRLPDDICLTAWNFLDEKDSIKKATYKHSNLIYELKYKDFFTISYNSPILIVNLMKESINHF